MTPTLGQQLISISNLAERTEISIRTWRRIIASGQIGVYRIGRRIKIPEAEIERFLMERFVSPKVEERNCRPRQSAIGSVASLVDAVVGKQKRRGDKR